MAAGGAYIDLTPRTNASRPLLHLIQGRGRGGSAAAAELTLVEDDEPLNSA
jgi:hypothetical protein